MLLPSLCLISYCHPAEQHRTGTEGLVVLSNCYHGSSLPSLDPPLDAVCVFEGLTWFPVSAFLPVRADRRFLQSKVRRQEMEEIQEISAFNEVLVYSWD